MEVLILKIVIGLRFGQFGSVDCKWFTDGRLAGKGESTQAGTVLLMCDRRAVNLMRDLKAVFFLGGRRADFFVCGRRADFFLGGRKTSNGAFPGHGSLQKNEI